MSIDFQEDSDSHVPTKDELLAISTLVKTLKKRSVEVANLERELKAKRAALDQVSKRDLPEAMKAARLSKFTTDDGLELSLREDVYATISDANREEALNWLENNGFGDIIKTSVEVSFGRGDRERAEACINLLDTNHYDCQVKETVHPQTLRAFLREQLAQGNEVPLELFSAFEFKEAIVK